MKHARKLLASLLVGFTASIAQAYPFNPSSISKALDQSSAWRKAHPDRSEGYFFLGAVEDCAWAKGTQSKDNELAVDSFGDGDTPPKFSPWQSVLFECDTKREIIEPELKALGVSIAAYRKAVELSPDKPLYHLALGWSLEQAGEAKLNPANLPGDPPAPLTDEETKKCHDALELLRNTDTAPQGSKDLAELMPRNAELLMRASMIENNSEVGARIDSVRQEYWTAQAIEQYRKAYQQTVDKDLAATNYDAEADKAVSVKAGDRLLLLLPKRPDSSTDEIKKIDESVKAIKAKPIVGHVY